MVIVWLVTLVVVEDGDALGLVEVVEDVTSEALGLRGGEEDFAGMEGVVDLVLPEWAEVLEPLLVIWLGCNALDGDNDDDGVFRIGPPPTSQDDVLPLPPPS